MLQWRRPAVDQVVGVTCRAERSARWCRGDADAPVHSRAPSRLDVVHHLAEVNVARLLAPLDDPSMRDFVAAVGPVERLAAASSGFVWRLADQGGHGVCVQPDDGGPVFVNLTLWRDYDALHVFTYRSPHADHLKRRLRWFAPTPQPSTALWWVPAGTRPTLDDALRRLRLLRTYGPTPKAFSLRRRFDPDGRPAERRRPRPDRASAGPRTGRGR
jgi:hypothetical protein